MRPTTVLAIAVRVAGDHEVDGRVLQRLRRSDDRALPRPPRLAVDRVGAEHGALVDDDDLHLDARAAQPLGLALGCARPRRGTARPCGGAGRTSSGVVLTVGADDADAHAVDAEAPSTASSQSGASPVASSTMLADRNGKLARAWWARMRSTPKSNSWLPKLVASRPHAFSTSIAGLSSSSAEFGGDAPTLSPAASSSVGPGSDAASSSNIVASCAAPPTVTLSPSIDRRRLVELAVEVVQPDDRQRRVARARCRAGRAARRPGCAAAPGRRAGTPPSGARSMLRTSRATPRSIAVPPARNVARMFVLLVEVLHVGHVAVLAEERRAGDQRARRGGVELVRRRRRRRRGRRCASGAPCRPCCPGRWGCGGPRPW